MHIYVANCAYQCNVEYPCANSPSSTKAAFNAMIGVLQIRLFARRGYPSRELFMQIQLEISILIESQTRYGNWENIKYLLCVCKLVKSKHYWGIIQITE